MTTIRFKLLRKKKEYYQDIKEKRKAYYEANKEQINAKQRLKRKAKKEQNVII